MKQLQAIEFVERCAGETDTRQLVEDFGAAMQSCGFAVCAGGAWTGVGAERLYRFYFNSWPADWLELYERERFFAVDPIVGEVRRAMAPFAWSELRPAFAGNATFARIGGLIDAHGWREVFAVPIHGPAGYEGMVSMAAKADVALDAGDRALIELMSLAIHRRCRLTPGFGTGLPVRASLTPRQLECLKWAAGGKTDGEIAAVLGLSESTVHFHIEVAKKRLRVRSRVQAVALLVLDGTI